MEIFKGAEDFLPVEDANRLRQAVLGSKISLGMKGFGNIRLKQIEEKEEEERSDDGLMKKQTKAEPLKKQKEEVKKDEQVSKENEKPKIEEVFKAKDFNYKSQVFSNLSLIYENEIPNCKCALIINSEKKIEIPLILAVLSSKVITDQYLNDVTSREFHTPVHFFYPVSDSFYQKLNDAIHVKNISLDTEEEIINFACFGKAIGNVEYYAPLNDLCNDKEKSLSKENVLIQLERKIFFNFDIAECQPEIKFLAENFESMKEDLLRLSKNPQYYHIIVSIVSSGSLMLKNEDSLLEFILMINNENSLYETLFDFVLLQYCSMEMVLKLIDFSKQLITNKCIGSIINCFSKRLLHEMATLYPPASINRYSDDGWVDLQDPSLKRGILYEQFLKGNLKIDPSSVSNRGDLFNIVKNGVSNTFSSGDRPNSNIVFSTKNKSQFIVTKYMIQGRSQNNNQMRSWKVEGLKDGQWILLHSQENNQFDENEIKSFDVDVHEPISAVRLQQTAKNSGNSYFLNISHFEVFGKVKLQ